MWLWWTNALSNHLLQEFKVFKNVSIFSLYFSQNKNQIWVAIIGFCNLSFPIQWLGCGCFRNCTTLTLKVASLTELSGYTLKPVSWCFLPCFSESSVKELLWQLALPLRSSSNECIDARLLEKLLLAFSAKQHICWKLHWSRWQKDAPISSGWFFGKIKFSWMLTFRIYEKFFLFVCLFVCLIDFFFYPAFHQQQRVKNSKKEGSSSFLSTLSLTAQQHPPFWSALQSMRKWTLLWCVLTIAIYVILSKTLSVWRGNSNVAWPAFLS